MVVLDHIKIMDTERPVSVHQGTLVVRDSQFITNTGPVLNMGDSFGVVKKNLEVSNSTFKQNFGSAFLTFGANVTIDATEVIGRSDETDRGSIFFDGTLKIRNSHFNNIWGGSQCGGALQSSSRTTIANSSFNNNRSNCGGGAAWFFGEPQEVDLRAVTYTDNQTTGLGGAVLIELNNPAEIQIRHGEFRNNRADVGGAIYFSTRFGHLGIRATALSFKGNSAEKLGGAVYVKDSGFQLTRGIFVDNKSSTGGVIMFEGTNPPPFVIANSLVARNKSPSAIQGFTGDIINSTIADNDSLGLSVSGHLRLTNTVISNNKKHNCHTASLGGLIEDRGGNLQFPGTDCSSTIPSADPDLDSFYVPDLDSPLQRAGINDVCLAKPIGGQDVYGQRRPRADRCTIGAVEGDIEQILHHIGVTGTKAPPGEGGGGEGGATGSSGDGENTLIVPLEWCVLLILFLIVALLLLYIKMKTP
jgi:predicted outer membrane repeat protein